MEKDIKTINESLENIYLKLLDYAKCLIRGYVKQGGNVYNYDHFDICSAAICENPKNYIEAKKTLRILYLKGVEQKKADKQNKMYGGSGISADYAKKCNMCNEVKNQSEFTHVSKESGYTYLLAVCKPCNNEKARARRKIKQLSDKEKKQARIRYERWKLKHGK